MSAFEAALQEYDGTVERLAIAIAERDAARDRIIAMHADLLGCITTPATGEGDREHGGTLRRELDACAACKHSRSAHSLSFLGCSVCPCAEFDRGEGEQR